ncbi:MAG: hypothetical protein ABIK86_00440 [candidate division WOR-3 bacterium]
MNRLLLLLVPLSLLAQVEVDTVIRLHSRVWGGHYVPELNKLYLCADSKIIVADCSAYQVKTEIPYPGDPGPGRFTWNPDRQKLYFSANSLPETLFVIDAAADTAVAQVYCPAPWNSVYAPNVDRLYYRQGRPLRSLAVLDCATDSVVQEIPPPAEPYSFGDVSWDSLHKKVYASLVVFGYPTLLAAVDVCTDSLWLLDVPNINFAQGLVFNHARHKAYYVGSPLVAICTDGDTVIKVLSVGTPGIEFDEPVALNTRDDKLYVSGFGPVLRVIDCATDSVVKTIPYPAAWPACIVRWVPWSNRIYCGNSAYRCDTTLWVLDCATDSFIAGLDLGEYDPFGIQLDPIRQRIFAIGADTLTVHVLRDLPDDVAEEPGRKPAAAVPLRVLPSPARDRVWLEGADKAVLFTPDGRRVATLTYGSNYVRHLSRGVYFVRCPERRESKRVVLVE